VRLAHIIVLKFCVGLAGCFPAPVTVQPKAQFLVRDAGGQPIQGASVTLATHRMPFPSNRTRTLRQYETDAAGKVSLRTKRTWEWKVLLPDGSSWYSWIYCIDKPGYRPVFSVQPDFSTTVIATLERSDQRLVCQWPTDNESYYDLRVVKE
jgi:hypothetical protein